MKLTIEQHNLLSAMQACNIDINAQGHMASAAGIDEGWLYPEHYVDIQEDGIYPYEDVWEDIPNWRKNEILTTAYEYQSKGLYGEEIE